MRYPVRKISLAMVGLITLVIAWILAARPLSMMLDRLHTVPLESHAIARLGLEDMTGGLLRLDDLMMNAAAPDYHRYPMTMVLAPSGQLSVQTAGHLILVGSLDKSLGGTPALRPAPGEEARLTIERSLLSWPTPLEFNFMTGHAPSWKRHLYYRLAWAKPNGARLEMVWRYEQYYYDAWASGFMTREGTTGLISVDIRP